MFFYFYGQELKCLHLRRHTLSTCWPWHQLRTLTWHITHWPDIVTILAGREVVYLDAPIYNVVVRRFSYWLYTKMPRTPRGINSHLCVYQEVGLCSHDHKRLTQTARVDCSQVNVQLQSPTNDEFMYVFSIMYTSSTNILPCQDMWKHFLGCPSAQRMMTAMECLLSTVKWFVHACYFSLWFFVMMSVQH